MKTYTATVIGDVAPRPELVTALEGAGFVVRSAAVLSDAPAETRLLFCGADRAQEAVQNSSEQLAMVVSNTPFNR